MHPIRVSVAVLLASTAVCLCAACGTEPAGNSSTAVRLNELCPVNHNTADATGNTGDWIELVNLGASPVSLEGYYLSDDADERLGQPLTADAVVPANGILLLWADGSPERGSLHLGFKLSAGGEGVWFSNPQGYVIDSVEFNAAPALDSDVDASFARYPDGTGRFGWCGQSTPGENNGARCANPVP
jgi:hypothetical protein